MADTDSVKPVGIETATIVSLAISAALQAASYYLLKPKNRSPIQADRQPTLSTRGSYLNLVLGTQRVAPFFAWASTPRVSGSTQLADGWHIYSHGPAAAINRFWVGGKVVFGSILTPATHPSGSSFGIQLVDGQSSKGTIYWGEDDGPIWRELVGPTGLSSSWPNLCGVFWENVPVSGGQWQNIDAEIVVEPRVPTGLLNSPGFVPDLFDPGVTGVPVYKSYGFDLNNYQGSSLMFHQKDIDAYNPELAPGTELRLTLTDSTVLQNRIAHSYKLRSWNGSSIEQHVVVDLGIRIPDTPFVATTDFYKLKYSGGVNIAHGIAQLLFERRPYGLGLDPLEYDISSLRELEALSIFENLYMNTKLTDGMTVDQFIGLLMQDFSVMFGWDPTASAGAGLYKWTPVRNDRAFVPQLREEHFVTKPRHKTKHFALAETTRPQFYFNSRSKSYNNDPVVLPSEGRHKRFAYRSTKQVNIKLFSTYDAAVKCSTLRSVLEMGQLSTIELRAQAGARLVHPGQPVSVLGFSQVFRVTSIKVSLENGWADIELLEDASGARISASRLSSLQDSSPGGSSAGGVQEGVPGAAVFRAYQVPAALAGADPEFWLLWARPSPRVTHGYAFYNIVPSLVVPPYGPLNAWGTVSSWGTVGSLKSSLTAGAAEGSLVIEGLDVQDVLDLTNDQVSYDANENLALVEDEIMAFRKLTALAPGLWKLEGLKRGQYGTVDGTHAATQQVFLFRKNQERLTGFNVGMGDKLNLTLAPVSPSGMAAITEIAASSVIVA